MCTKDEGNLYQQEYSMGSCRKEGSLRVNFVIRCKAKDLTMEIRKAWEKNMKKEK